MPVDDRQFRTEFEERIESERKAVALLRESMDRTKNPVIRLLLNQLALDSAKHEVMLKAILKILESPQDSKLQHESREFQVALDRHVQIELEMLEGFERLVEKSDDKRVRFMLQDIVNDEKRHHAVVKRIRDLVFRGQIIKDDKWWDFLHRYSRLTG